MNSQIENYALNPDKKWAKILKFFETKNISYKNILKILDFSFVLPAYRKSFFYI